MFVTDAKNVRYCIFVHAPNDPEAKVYTPFFQSLDEADEYANYMRVYLPRDVIVSEPYPVVNDSVSLEKEFSKVIKKER